MSNGRFALVSLKAFGDLVIARWALGRIAPSASAPVQLLLGAHLVQLNDALGDTSGTLVIPFENAGVPAFYNVRECGPGRALRSGFEMRAAIRGLRLRGDTTLVFDRIGLRERFLSAGRHRAALPAGLPNIYLAYEEFLRPLGLTNDPRQATTTGARTTVAPHVGIFPGSRIAGKRMPADVVAELTRHCDGSGVPYRIFVLQGEPSDIPATAAHVTMVPRQFDAMASAVRGSRAVISADSMPAHVAEYFGVPVFVLSPMPNRFWLPKSCFDSSRWSLFSDLPAAGDQLQRFICGC